MLLEVIHETTFTYSAPVHESYLEFRLTPVTDSLQYVLQHKRRTTAGRHLRHYLDHFGNHVTYFNCLQPVETMTAGFESVVETRTGDRPGDGSPTGLRDSLAPTTLVPFSGAVKDYAMRFKTLREGNVAEAALRIVNEIYGGFRYVPGVTDTTTSATDFVEHGEGVCQDFAHLMLACCRINQVPARYVSGYIFLEAHEDRAEASLASHAWCEVFDAERGWIGIDPTHNLWVEERHVRLGVGRDFSDVPPNRGVYRGIAEETVAVAVTIRPMNSAALEDMSRRYFAPAPQAATRQTRKAPAVSVLQQAALAQQLQQQQ
jgi:transglutaminase-like putative cysteine protease